jgi:hypothetical protein
MKNWKTTVLGILAAALILATSKGWVDNDIAAFIGSALAVAFGGASKDFNVSGIVGGNTPPSKDEK